jgi:tetratricopeptide (TPR) repeat protein
MRDDARRPLRERLPSGRSHDPMKLKRQLLRPGARIEQVAGLASHPFFRREPAREAESANPPPPPRPPRGVLVRVAENAGAVFSILVSVVLIALIVALVAAFVKEFQRDSVVVTPIGVPQDIAARGYDPVAASQLVVDEIARVEASAQTSHVRRSLVSGSDIPDVHIIGAGTSMQSIVRYARSAFGRREATIGARVLRDPAGLRMVINLADPRGDRRLEVDRHDEDIDALLKDGGRAIVQLADPYVLASYLYNDEAASGVFTRTEAAIDYVLRNPPADDDGWALNLRGLILERGGKLAAAEATWRRARTLHGAPVVIIDNNLAAMLGAHGRRDDAHAIVMAGIARDPPFDALQNACTTLFWTGFVDDGRAACGRAAAAEPTVSDPWQWIALYDYAAGHYEAAWRALAKARTLAPAGDLNWTPAYVFIGAARGHAREALADADDFAAAMGPDDPNRPWLHYARALALAALGRDADATVELDAFDRGTRGVPWSYFGRVLRGEIELREGRPRDALARFDAALAINPTNGAILADKARALAALGDAAGAEQAFAEAARRAPDRAGTYGAWADARAARGDVAGAQQLRAEAARAAARARAA